MNGVLARPSRGCAAPPLPVTWSPSPSLSARAGAEVTLSCHFRSGRGPARVTWERTPPPPPGPARAWVTWAEEGRAWLRLRDVTSRDAGTYRCRVRDAAGGEAVTCGTALRVSPLLPSPLLPLSEGTKNRLLVAQGILLLGAAVGPGLMLLLRKRWAHERLLKEKKSEEEENVYEGLTMDVGSLYESLAVEQPQLQYQDVGGVQGAELETP
ncbi:B-cell antigen receptor complex-associated protein alpha chain [Melopsittacus undulatus]|uniref:B-cell antigen receptor complex-associated protein alpha chain n=1 Tax=Melopsittacus undulatus TaxID=13146 RepID=UPI00146C6FB9|nr:B-cell antigen receptor complex-associated protein alpha chain [Melopsittacus undulatus]